MYTGRDVKAKDAAVTATYNMKGAAQRPRPTRVGRYQLGEPLGTGGMGVVYRAHDPDLDRAVAIKVVRAGGDASESRLLREAQAMARLRHPNVVPIFDVGPAEGAVFVAMPLLEGGTLRHWLQRDAPSFGEVLDRFVAAGHGLAAAHAAGLVHRDFKPENVLLGDNGETVVSDFGLACLASDETAPSPSPSPSTSTSALAPGAITASDDVLGTPDYMAPEQLRGRPSDARADQFSFCVALWEAIYGDPPFPESADGTEDALRARLAAITTGPVPPPRRDRPAWIAPLLVRGLAADPDRRWPSMQALLDAIAARRAPRRWPWYLAAALGTVGLALTLAVAIRPPSPPLFHLVSLTHRGDLKHAAISPDGSKLAMVVGEALVIRGIEPDAEERVIVDHGITDTPIAWSPDGKHLLAGTVPEIAPMIENELIDIDRGVQWKLPMNGVAAFLSSTEVAVTYYRQRSVTILPLGEHATATATCQVPGDYTFLLSLIALPDGTMVVKTQRGETDGLVILGRDCRVRATFSGEPISSIAVSDTGTIVALIVGDGFGEILEISPEGAVVSRRRVSGAFGRIIGRRHGTDYVSTLALATHLERVHGGVPSPPPLLSIAGGASFSLAPDGETLAWVDLAGHSGGPGRLWLSTVQNLSESQHGRWLLDNALTVDWSPDGRSLAVLVDEGTEVAIVVVDRYNAIPPRRLPLRHLAREPAPVWLDGHRIAAQTDDRTTYRWFDLESGAEGDITDRTYGSTYYLTRSPRDGTLAMWRNGPPDANGAITEHLWVQEVGHDARPLHVQEARKHYLVPSWSPSGELLVRAFDTGKVSRVALDTGELTPIAQLPRMPLSRVFDDHLMTLADGDLLAAELELGINIAVVAPDDESRPRAPSPPLPGLN